MAKNDNLHDFLKGIADKIRELEGSSDSIAVQDFEGRIEVLAASAPQLTQLEITPQKNGSIHTPTAPYSGFSSVTVSQITSAVDENIKSENIKSGVTILGVSGSYTASGSTPSSPEGHEIILEGQKFILNY